MIKRVTAKETNMLN